MVSTSSIDVGDQRKTDAAEANRLQQPRMFLKGYHGINQCELFRDVD